MADLIEVVSRLTQEERRAVQDFAEFLLARRTLRSPAVDRPGDGHSVSFEGWAGCLSHLDPEKSDKQLVREAWADLIGK